MTHSPRRNRLTLILAVVVMLIVAFGHFLPSANERLDPT
jgi:hypothetical protein